MLKLWKSVGSCCVVGFVINIRLLLPELIFIFQILFKEEYVNQEKQNQLLQILIQCKLNGVNPSHQQTHRLTSTTLPSCVVMPTYGISQDCCDSDAPDPPLDHVMAASTDYGIVIPDNKSQSSFFKGVSPSSSKFYCNLAEQFFDSCIVLLLLLYHDVKTICM